MHSRNHIIRCRSVLGLKKGLLDIEGFCVYKVAQARNSTACGIVIRGPYDSRIPLGANPYVVKCPNSGIKPETEPVRAQYLSCMCFYGGPFLPYEEYVGYFPFLEVATAPEAGMIRFLDDGNEVADIHKALEKFAHLVVVGLPVRKEIGSQGATAVCVLRNIMQKFVLVISTITQRTWRWVPAALMRENLIVEGPVTPHDNHRLRTARTTRAWAISASALRIQFWPKFRSVRLNRDLLFDVVRVKRCFHGSNSYMNYAAMEIQRYKRRGSPAIVFQLDGGGTDRYSFVFPIRFCGD